MTQREAILTLFKQGHTLNWIEAFKLTGSETLRNRVSEWIKQGYVFEKEIVTFTTRYGTKGQYMNYRLIAEPNKNLIN